MTPRQAFQLQVPPSLSDKSPLSNCSLPHPTTGAQSAVPCLPAAALPSLSVHPPTLCHTSQSSTQKAHVHSILLQSVDRFLSLLLIQPTCPFSQCSRDVLSPRPPTPLSSSAPSLHPPRSTNPHPLRTLPLMAHPHSMLARRSLGRA